jgi:hypothetical protein
VIEAKAFRTFIRLYSLFKNERLKANIKLNPLKALIKCVMTFVCPAWEFAAEIHLLKLQRLQNRVLRTTGNFSRRTSVRDLHVVFQIPYVYDYLTKLCRQQADVIQNHDNENYSTLGERLILYLPFLGNGFQLRVFLSRCILELSPTSATSELIALVIKPRH